MKNLIIIGAGTAGTMILNKLYKKLDDNDWCFTIIDKEELHYYQPGFLFIPFGIYQPEDVIKPKKNFIPSKVNFIIDEVEKINGERNELLLKKGESLKYDLLIIATGTEPVPEETIGLKDKLWYKDVFDFYTFEGSVKLSEKLKNWEGGKLVINLSESIIKLSLIHI